MSEPAASPFDIYIVGTGTVGVRQITKEVEAALRRSNEVLFVDKAFGVAEYLATMCPKVTDLHEASYRQDEARLAAYGTMAARVIDAALDHPPVTFALYGHPLIFARPPFQVMLAAKALGLEVQVLPGISSLDTIFVDLGLDPAVQGLQLYEATDVLLRQRPLQSDVPCLLWQIGAIETRLYSVRASKPERFSRIKRYLLRFYPPDHRVVAVSSSTYPLLPSTLVEFALADIEDHASELHQGISMYIPPVGPRPIADEELLRAMDSRDHLDDITQPPD